MNDITLRDYFDTMGYGKYTSKINVSTFAKKCNVSISVISRILKGKYEIKHSSEAFDKVAKVVKDNGYNLILNNQANEIERLEEMVKLLEEENAILKEMLNL